MGNTEMAEEGQVEDRLCDLEKIRLKGPVLMSACGRGQ